MCCEEKLLFLFHFRSLSRAAPRSETENVVTSIIIKGTKVLRNYATPLLQGVLGSVRAYTPLSARLIPFLAWQFGHVASYTNSPSVRNHRFTKFDSALLLGPFEVWRRCLWIKAVPVLFEGFITQPVNGNTHLTFHSTPPINHSLQISTSKPDY